MATVKLMKLNKNLKCLICGCDDFSHNEEKIQIVKYVSGYMQDVRDGCRDAYLERVTCRGCGWSTTFENSYDIDLNDQIIQFQGY